jgi:hypothetical protein
LSQATAAEHLFSNGRGELWAWAVVDCNLSFSIARPSFCEALRASIPPEFRALARFSVPEAAEIKAEITNLATKLRQIVRLKYQGSPCLLALDGGTLHRTTLLNFMLLSVRPNQCWSYDNFINHGMNEIFGKRAFSLWIMEKGLKTRLKTMERFSIIGP